MSPRLYELSEDYVALSEMLENAETPAAEQEIALALREISGSLLHKVDSIVALIKEFEYNAEALSTEIERLKARSRTSESKAAWLRNYLIQQLDVIDLDHVRTPRFSVYAQTTQAVEVTDETELPGRFKKIVVTTKPDKVAIREAILKDGEVVPGAKITENRHLRIT